MLNGKGVIIKEFACATVRKQLLIHTFDQEHRQIIKTNKANSSNKQTIEPQWSLARRKNQRASATKLKEAHATTRNPTSSIRCILFGVYLVTLRN
jgi:hypothetical protein